MLILGLTYTVTSFLLFFAFLWILPNYEELTNFSYGWLAKRQAIFGAITGFITYSWLVLWMQYVTTLGYIMLAILLTVFIVIWLVIVSLLAKFILYFKHKFISLLMLYFWVVLSGLLYATLSYVRSVFPLGGFAWYQLAESFIYFDFIHPVLRLGGGYLVTMLVMLISATIYAGYLAYKTKLYLAFYPLVQILLAIFITVIIVDLVNVRTYTTEQQLTKEPLNFIGIQPDVPFNPYNQGFDAGTARHLLYNTTISALNHEVDAHIINVMVWPESIIPLPERDEPVYHQLVDLTGAQYVLYGATQLIDGNFYTSMIPYAYGKRQAVYHKHHLVPWGEYLPGANFLPKFIVNWFPFGGGGYTAGKKDVKIYLGQVVAAPLICFEDGDLRLMRRYALTKPDLFIVIINNGWFRLHSEYKEHIRIAYMNAIILNTPILSVTNNGISAFLSNKGVHYFFSQKKLYSNGYFSYKFVAPWNRPVTFYTKHGIQYLYWLWLGIATIIVVIIMLYRYGK